MWDLWLFKFEVLIMHCTSPKYGIVCQFSATAKMEYIISNATENRFFCSHQGYSYNWETLCSTLPTSRASNFLKSKKSEASGAQYVNIVIWYHHQDPRQKNLLNPGIRWHKHNTSLCENRLSVKLPQHVHPHKALQHNCGSPGTTRYAIEILTLKTPKINAADYATAGLKRSKMSWKIGHFSHTLAVSPEFTSPPQERKK